jgi:N,N'-diacetyllegionaminate synthase
MGCMIIAEVGVNHDGDLLKALRLCDAAKSAGADIVKFQIYQIHKLMRPGSPEFMKLGNLSLPSAAFVHIAKYCESIGIEFCATPDDVDSLKVLIDECGVKRIKIGSGSLLYEPLVDAAFDTGLPVLLSTGMATKDEIYNTVQRQLYRNRFGDSILMHCVSLYPCPLQLANVDAITDISSWWQGTIPVGYSDHTKGTTAAMAAVALGATVIEKHFTLNNRDDGPDHAMSTEPWEFMHMVRDIREVECVLGDGRKEPGLEEVAMIPRIRKDAEGFQPGL